MEYLVQEVENQLVLTIKGKNDTEESSYYVTMNLFDEYEDGLVDESLGFTPVSYTHLQTGVE